MVNLLTYIIKRILLGIIVLLGVITVTFFLTRIVPSDPAAMWVGPRATPEQIAQATIDLGLDRPLYVQYFIYLQDLFQGDLGNSLRTRQPILTELKTFVPPTLELVFLATI